MHNKLFDIKGKVVIITGGYGVIGSHIAQYLASEGVSVIIIGRSSEKGNALVGTIKSSGGQASFYQSDVTEKEQLEYCNSEILKQYGYIDTLINAAGGNMPGAIIAPDKTIFDLDLEELKKVIDLNLFGTILPTLVFAKSMVDNGQGNIINMASMSSYRPLTRVMGYGIAKAAIVNFTHYMAGELSIKFGDKFRVNAVAPGFFITTQNHDLMICNDGSYSQRAKSIIAHTPFRRFGEVDELLGIIHYLISGASTFVNGSVIEVDGGFNSFSI